jgi:holin-like protein
MLHALLIIFGCQFAAEITVALTGLPVPAAILGMVFLLCGLIVKRGIPENLEQTTDTLLKYIGLLFIPAGAGISLYLGLITKEWDVILVASTGSTILTLAASALLFKRLTRDT